MTFQPATKIDRELFPVLSSPIATFLAGNSSKMTAWVEQYGSPLHLIWPSELMRNVRTLKNILEKHQIDHTIFFGAKVNKSSALMAAALRSGAGVDVSSVYELRDAVRVGAGGRDIVATGPAKSREFHEELVRLGAFVSVDSPEELDDLLGLVPSDANEQSVLLRVRPEGHERSRFGMPAEAIRSCLRRIAGDTRLRLDGFHFHLSGYRWEDRAAAIREAFGLIGEARAFGLSPRMIDIGGGLPVQYVSEVAWAAHLADQKAEDYRTGKAPDSFYPYGGAISAGQWLRDFLSAQANTSQSIADYLREQKLTLAMEPGRSLADQAALSVFRITRVKDMGRGNSVIFVEGSSFSACETWFASEFLVDPMLVPIAERVEPPKSVRAYIAGHSCLDEDVLSNRWLNFSTAPQAGDLLVWANTAGYQMDLLENESHRHPMPKRLCVTESPTGELSVNPDN